MEQRGFMCPSMQAPQFEPHSLLRTPKRSNREGRKAAKALAARQCLKLAILAVTWCKDCRPDPVSRDTSRDKQTWVPPGSTAADSDSSRQHRRQHLYDSIRNLSFGSRHTAELSRDLIPAGCLYTMNGGWPRGRAST